MTTFAKRLKEARAARKSLSQQQLANEIGVTSQSVSLMERGKMGPSAENILRLAHALDCDPFWLFPEWRKDHVAEHESIDDKAPEQPSPPQPIDAFAVGTWIDALLDARLRDESEREAARAEIDAIAMGDLTQIQPGVVALVVKLVERSRAPYALPSAPPPSPPPSNPGTRRKAGRGRTKRSG